MVKKYKHSENTVDQVGKKSDILRILWIKKVKNADILRISWTKVVNTDTLRIL